MNQMRDSDEDTYGRPYGGAKVMVDDNMMKGKQDHIRRGNDIEQARFSTPEAKNKNELGYKRQKTLSRFYGNDKVTPEEIAADIGPARLALKDGPDAVSAADRRGIKGEARLALKNGPEDDEPTVGNQPQDTGDNDKQVVPYKGGGSNEVNFY